MLLAPRARKGHKPPFLAFGATLEDDDTRVRCPILLVQRRTRARALRARLYRDEHDRGRALIVAVPPLPPGVHRDVVLETRHA